MSSRENGMIRAINNFPAQFGFSPKIEDAGRLRKYDNYLICGMGGSHLGADILAALMPELDILVHSDYGLPYINPKNKPKTLIILSSYSGNTEEVIDSFYAARRQHLSTAVIAVGGGLLELAKEHGVPYLVLPNTGIQPRCALGFSVLALLKLMEKDHAIWELKNLTKLLDSGSLRNEGEELAKKISGHVPVIYSSLNNRSVALNWKIKFNETGKIPAFYNILPELNHNEMTGFDVIKNTAGLSKNFYFIFLKDKSDNARVSKRMSVLEKLYQARGLRVAVINLKEGNKLKGRLLKKSYKTFSSLLLADWTAFYTALNYGAEPEKVPMVEEFKSLVK